MQCIETMLKIDLYLSGYWIYTRKREREREKKNREPNRTELNSSKCGSFISTSYRRSMCARNSRCMLCAERVHLIDSKVCFFRLILSLLPSFSIHFCTAFFFVSFGPCSGYLPLLLTFFYSVHQIAWTTKLNELHTMTWIALDSLEYDKDSPYIGIQPIDGAGRCTQQSAHIHTHTHKASILLCNHLTSRNILRL